MVDGHKKPPMAYIYEAMDRAKEAIAKGFSNKEENYKRAFKYIDKRWECKLHQPLHAAGHYLNLEIYYSNPSIEDCTKVMKGLFDCIARMVSNLETQDKILAELNSYKTSQGLLGMHMAIRQRKSLAPGKNIHTKLLKVSLFFVLAKCLFYFIFFLYIVQCGAYMNLRHPT